MTNRRTPQLSPSQDVRPVTEFRAHASAYLDQVRTTKHPLILTQHGRCAAVVLDVSVYEDLIEEVARLRERRPAEPARAPVPPFESPDVRILAQ